MNIVLKFEYIESIKIVSNRLTKSLPLIKHEYSVIMLGIAKKYKILEIVKLIL